MKFDAVNVAPGVSSRAVGMRIKTLVKTTCATVAMLLIGSGARADLKFATPAGFGAASAEGHHPAGCAVLFVAIG
jgi:hypothetical protein